MSQHRNQDDHSPLSTNKQKLIQPLGPRVLVRLVEDADRTPSGLFLPQGVQERHQVAHYGQVIEVARDTLATEAVGENVSGVPLGVYVLFPKNAGLPVPWDDTLRLVNTCEIVAVVEEVDLEDVGRQKFGAEKNDGFEELNDELDEEQH